MLKRGGKPVSLHEVPDSAQRLNDEQFAAYNAAFQTVERDLSSMKQVREELNRLEKIQLERPVPKAFETLTTLEGKWNAHAQLLKLFRSEVLLCRKSDGDQWAMIQRVQHNSPYAQTQGETDILLRGNDLPKLMTEYMAQMRHTLRFMASNLETKAQKVVWEQLPNDDSNKVVRAISERCDSIAENAETARQEQVRSVRQSRGIGI